MIYVVPIPEAELRSYLAVKAIAEASAKKADDDRVKASDAWSNLQFKLQPEPVKELQRKNLGEAWQKEYWNVTMSEDRKFMVFESCYMKMY